MSSRPVVFDELAITSAERAALARLREATGEIGGPMERHCLRCRHLAHELAGRRGWILDGEVLTVAATLHDIGLYPGVASGDAYVADGAGLARRLLAEHGWARGRIELCAQAIDRHHELRSQRGHGDEVEALRRADLADVSGGLIRWGLDRGWIAQLRREVPVDGLGRELAREIGRLLRERPATLPKIFWR